VFQLTDVSPKFQTLLTWQDWDQKSRKRFREETNEDNGISDLPKGRIPKKK